MCLNSVGSCSGTNMSRCICVNEIEFMKSSMLGHPFKLEVIIIRREWPNSALYKNTSGPAPTLGLHGAFYF